MSQIFTNFSASSIFPAGSGQKGRGKAASTTVVTATSEEIIGGVEVAGLERRQGGGPGIEEVAEQVDGVGEVDGAIVVDSLYKCCNCLGLNGLIRCLERFCVWRTLVNSISLAIESEC